MTNWILLRGLGREARHWGNFPRLLSAHDGGVPVDCFDLPGNGRLVAESSPASIEQMADYCHDELMRSGNPRPCHVLAMSLGAMVAVAWASRHPQDVATMVLINTSLRCHNGLRDRMRWRGVGVLLRYLLLPGSPAAIEEAILRLTSALRRDAPSMRTLLGQWTQWRRENPVTRGNLLRQLSAAASFRGGCMAPAVPCLLLASAGDNLVKPACSAQIANAWRVPMSLHSWAGHDLPLDDPAWVVREIDSWRRSVAAGAC